MKKVSSYLITAMLILSMLLGACAKAPADVAEDEEKPEEVVTPTDSEETSEGETRVFTDDSGRNVEIPGEVTKVAVTGKTAQIALFALAPDSLCALASDWDETNLSFVDEKYASLPVIGQLYGGKGDMNLEALLEVEPQVVIDIGESKDNIAEDMDELTEQTGIPFIHVEATLATYADAYSKLGELLGMEEEAAELSTYCADTYAKAVEISEKQDKPTLLYVVGEEGLGVIAKGSFHAEVIDLIADNAAVVEEPSSRGTGNKVEFEQIMIWDPEYIVFGTPELYEEAKQGGDWANLTAIKSGNFVLAPIGPYNWMGFPPAVQRYLGILWLENLLYPEDTGDLYEAVNEYFELFYHHELTQEEFDELMVNSVK